MHGLDTLFRYESRQAPVISGKRFLWRWLGHGLGALLLMATPAVVTLLLLERVRPDVEPARLVEHILLVMSGAGVIREFEGVHGGVAFITAGFAIVSQVLYLGVLGLMVAPVVHRVLHSMMAIPSATDGDVV